MLSSRKFIATLLSALQIWVPATVLWQSTEAAADTIVINAGEGQTDGSNMLGQSFSMIRNTQVVDEHADPAQGNQTNFQTGVGGTLNLKEIGLGGNLNEAKQKLQDAYAHPEKLHTMGTAARNAQLERGCRSTSFTSLGTKTILRVTPIKRTLLQNADGTTTISDEVDALYSGPVDIGKPSLGYARTWDMVLVPAEVGNPGQLLRYESVPFNMPNDGSYFVINHAVAGSQGTPVVVSDGDKANAWAPQAVVYATGQTITVTGELFRVNQTFTPSGGASCPPDPASCVVSGVNFCSGPAVGVWDVFATGQRHRVSSWGALMDTVSAPTYTMSDPNVAAIVNKGSLVLNGADPVFTEVFTQCRETSSSTTETMTVHTKNIKTCSMPLVNLPYTCNGSRGVHFTKLQTSTVITVNFWQRIQVPLIDPVTGQQAVDAQGNPLYTTQDIPAVYSGGVDVNKQLFGGVQSYETTPDANGYFMKYDLTPFSVSASEYFPYNITFASDGAVSSSVSSLGNKTNNWTLGASVSVSNASQLRVNSDVYMVVNNTLPGCDDYLRHAADGFCTPNMQCTDMRGPCTTLDGVSFCDSGATQGITDLLLPWGVADSAQNGGALAAGALGGGAVEYLPRLCWAATGQQMDCTGAYSGEMTCYTDINGVEHCNTVSGAGFGNSFGEAPMYLDDCQAKNLFGNPACTLVSSNTCSDGAAGLFSGTCYNKDVIYDCGTDTQVTIPGGVSFSQQCDSPIRCLGTECHNPKGEVNTDMGKAIASVSTVQGMAMEMTCAETGQKPASYSEPCSPVVFKGDWNWCKVPIGNEIGITPNCCEQAEEAAADAPDAVKYAQLLWYTHKLGADKAMVQTLAQAPGMSGFAQMLDTGSTAADQGVAATKNFLWDSASNIARGMGFDIATESAAQMAADWATDAALSAVNMGLSQAQLWMINDFLCKAGMQELADQMITIGASNALEMTPLGQEMMSAINALSTVFMVYSIAKIIGHIVFQCEEQELQLGIKKKQKLCHYVGNYCAKKLKFVGCIDKRQSYCCYKSAIGRIIAEQIREKQPGVAGGYGSASGPNCGGFTPQQLASADWSQVDLSEWIALMQEAGLLPDSAQKADTMWGLNSSHGALALGSSSPTEVNPQQQTLARYGNGVTDGIINNRNGLTQLPVCSGIDTRQTIWYQTNVDPAQIIREIGGTGRVEYCGDGCIDIYLGQVGDDYLHDSCSAPHDQNYAIYVELPQYIDSAQLMGAKWDDHIRVTIGNQIAYISDYYNSDPPSQCELAKSWCWGEDLPGALCSGIRPANHGDDPIDVTGIFKQGGQIDTNTRVWVGGGGEGYARVRVRWHVPGPNDPGTACIWPSGQMTP